MANTYCDFNNICACGRYRIKDADFHVGQKVVLYDDELCAIAKIELGCYGFEARIIEWIDSIY